MTLSELKAMISLLDDPDAEIARLVANDLEVRGYAMYDAIEEICWSGDLEEDAQNNLETVLLRITFRNIKPQIAELLNDCDHHVLQILYLVATLIYPRLAFDELQKSIASLRRNIALEVNPTYSTLRNISEFNRVLYDTYQFRLPEPSNQHAITNYMINDVLATHCSNPALLSLIYWHIAYNLHLSVEPILLPNMVLLAGKSTLRSSPRYAQTDISFYINPADKGNAYARKEIITFLNDCNIGFDQNMLQPCTIRSLLHRYLLQVAEMFKHNEKRDIAKKMRQLALLAEV